MRSTFAVGRLNRDTSELVLRTRREAPFPGPWRLQAVVGPSGARLRQDGVQPQRRVPTRVLPFPGVQQD